MEIEKEIETACDTYGVPIPLARAVCMYESGGNDGLVSSDGARGYFQVMPATFRILKVGTNIEAGVKYLSWLLREYGREDDALAAYNGGPRRLNKGKKLPMETLQYVVGVGIYRSLLTYEEPEIRAEASRLALRRVEPGEDWPAIRALTKLPLMELRLHNPYQALRPLRPGSLIVYPDAADPSLLDPPAPGPGATSHYRTRRGDNYLLLAFAFGIDLDQFRKDNTLWRIPVPFEGMNLLVRPGLAPAPLLSAVSGASIPSLVAPLDAEGSPLPGQALALLAPASSRAAASSGPDEAPRSVVHKVLKGETLTRIASRYGVSVQAIRAANRLRRSRLSAGQLLKIPLG